MAEQLDEEVARLLDGVEIDPAQVSSIRNECARRAAAYLSGYHGAENISHARRWAVMYRRCQEWLDTQPQAANGAS